MTGCANGLNIQITFLFISAYVVIVGGCPTTIYTTQSLGGGYLARYHGIVYRCSGPNLLPVLLLIFSGVIDLWGCISKNALPIPLIIAVFSSTHLIAVCTLPPPLTILAWGAQPVTPRAVPSKFLKWQDVTTLWTNLGRMGVSQGYPLGSCSEGLQPRRSFWLI